jgi:hypothetical protein
LSHIDPITLSIPMLISYDKNWKQILFLHLLHKKNRIYILIINSNNIKTNTEYSTLLSLNRTHIQQHHKLKTNKHKVLTGLEHQLNSKDQSERKGTMCIWISKTKDVWACWNGRQTTTDAEVTKGRLLHITKEQRTMIMSVI